jgi:hypothetical protein
MTNMPLGQHGIYQNAIEPINQLISLGFDFGLWALTFGLSN